MSCFEHKQGNLQSQYDNFIILYTKRGGKNIPLIMI